jgi:diguanylate cyclase (GGDEF)-like protein
MQLIDKLLRQEKDKVANTIVFLVGVLSIIPTIGSLLRASDIGWQPVMTLHVFVSISVWCIYFFRHHLPYWVRSGWVTTMFLLGGIGGIMQFGVVGNGMVFLIFGTILGTILFSARVGAGLAVIGIITIVIGAYLSVVHHRKPNFDLSPYIVSPEAWGDVLFSFIFISVVVIVAISKIYQSLISALKFASLRNKEIELVIEERTKQLEEANNQLQKLAQQDSLTGLLNCGAFKTQLQSELEQANLLNAPLSLLMLDIDHFKHINDTYGHPVGDNVIVSITRTMSQLARKSDIIGRVGGEEFAIILPDTNAKLAMTIAERIRMEIEKARFESEDIAVAISIGVALQHDDEDIYSLLSRADQALYIAKRNGRNRVELANLKTEAI